MKVKLYKYTPHIKNFIENPMLRCTPAHELNDPFELQPNSETLDDFYKSYTGSYSFDDAVKYLDIQGSNSCGVISLTETKSNLLMWSHYADEHRGAVIELAFDIKFDDQGKLLQRGFLNSIADNQYLFDRVKYRIEREPDSELFDRTGHELLSDLKEHLSFTKAEAWSYEKEHRFLCELNSADIVCVVDSERMRDTLEQFSFMFQKARFNNDLLHLMDFNISVNDLTIDLKKRLKEAEFTSILKEKNDSIFHFYKVNPACITGIYLGCKSSNETTELFSNIQEIQKIYPQLYDNIKKEKLCNKRYDVVFETIT